MISAASVAIRILGLAMALTAAACGDSDGVAPLPATPTPAVPAPSPTPTGYVEAREPCAAHNPQRNAYFGDLHVHTTYSFDAHAFDVRTTPEQAYRFARGEPVFLPPLDEHGNGTRRLQLDRPLDFAAVTDHAEFLGEVEACTTPGSAAYEAPNCQQYRVGSYDAVRRFGVLLTPRRPRRFTDICGTDGSACTSVAGEVWERVQDAAAAAYDRTSRCAFTSFVAYEYSLGTGVSTLHRNVIFRNDRVPFPTSAFEQATPQGLWRQLQTTCLDTDSGCDVLAIPHNPNESNGNMFFVEYPGATTPDEEFAQAELRSRMEPVLEIFQHKGDSECMNGLSGVVGAPDELCEFEKRGMSARHDCGDGRGSLGTGLNGCLSRVDFARGILLAGMKEQERLGINPYRLGFIGSTDTHNGAPGAVLEKTFLGHRGTDDDSAAKLLGPGVLTPGGIRFNPGGLAAVWAEENSRPAIFDALRRREVFATSGPRIAVRFFGGWQFGNDPCGDPRLVEKGYAAGVPMGGVLPPAPAGAAAPTFVVTALSDAGTEANPGAPLQRLQIVKGWIENGEAHEQVFDVAGNAENGATVDLDTCTPRGAGAASLCGVWTDPAFDARRHAFYYARAVENPTCRWSTYLCNTLPQDQRPPVCTDPAVPATIQERAWTSPIWHEPAA